MNLREGARNRWLGWVLGAAYAGAIACGSDEGVDAPPPPPPPQAPQLRERFQSSETESCNMASPVIYQSAGGSAELVVVALDGLIRGLDVDSGDELWRARVPAPSGQVPIVLATPARVGRHMILAWQNTETADALPNQGTSKRISHRVALFDLAARRFDPDYPELTLSATRPAHDGGEVEFESAMQLLRSAVLHVEVPDRELGLAYISLGNGPSRQPFHGWLFELDLDRWRAEGAEAATANVLLTTAERDCTPSEATLETMVCGGGIWTPAGPLLSRHASGDYELIVPTGNGRVNFDKRAYANGLLRTGRGLPLEPDCSTAACLDFDELDPKPECLASCQNLFVARMPSGQRLEPEHSLCAGKTFLECYGILDADFGASAPVEVQVPGGPRVFAHTAKDGGLYLVDAEHMGTLYDRQQALAMCGTDSDPCSAHWTGQFVTQPVVAQVAGEPVVIAVGHMFDRTHAAGLVAYRIEMRDGAPRLQRLWQAPDVDSELARVSFRRHPGRPVLFNWSDGESYVAVSEPRLEGGEMWVVRARDGVVVQRRPLALQGVRYAKPALWGGTLYVPTCEIEGIGRGRIHAFDLVSGPATGGGVTGDGGGVQELCEPGGGVCTAQEYCDRARCGAPGLCRPRPTSCPEDDGAVCGCDGQTHASECRAQQAGTIADSVGPCAG